jgi:S-adenosylmethionine:tRNA ribosyltransferase-isomerase
VIAAATRGSPLAIDRPGAQARSSGELAARRAESDADRAPVLRSDEVPRDQVRLVVIDAAGGRRPRLERFAALPRLLRAGDLVVVNDAATLPASLPGVAGGQPFELRLSGPVDAGRLSGVLLGPGDHRTRTEHRAPPPRLQPGDRVTVAGLAATVVGAAGRRVELAVRCDGDALWQTLYAAGAPVQYAHRSERLPLWSVQTGYAGRPWAAEMPSAGRPLTWDVVLGLRRAGIGVASLTHAAGLSSTGDEALDRALPWPERFEIPRRTAEAVDATRARGGRVIAVGTSVVRALEAAVDGGGGCERPAPLRAAGAAPGSAPRAERPIRIGSGVATLRLDAAYRPRVVAGLVSGLHVPGESHFELLSAFAPADQLRRAIALAAQHGLSGHELGDACLILPA